VLSALILLIASTTRKYRVLDSSEIPSHLKYGVAYTTWSINAPLYIKWLEARLIALGVVFVRATIQSIEEPFLQPYGAQPVATVVVNASGLGARSLIGVEDHKVFPIRGQTVLIWAPHFKKTV
jgi:glycine/D-amino acid oxidase-like deaminating enzyme